jgi:hypothetical protein
MICKPCTLGADLRTYKRTNSLQGTTIGDNIAKVAEFLHFQCKAGDCFCQHMDADMTSKDTEEARRRGR